MTIFNGTRTDTADKVDKNAGKNLDQRLYRTNLIENRMNLNPCSHFSGSSGLWCWVQALVWAAQTRSLRGGAAAGVSPEELKIQITTAKVTNCNCIAGSIVRVLS